jgi:peptidoglycan/xylan/chitin deacetylase (PgdA/CDA1 family)
MMPAPSTMVYPRDHRSPLTMAAYHPTQMLLRAVQAEISQTTGADLSPRPAATNVLGPISPSASASSKTNTANPALAKPAAPASTNSLRATPVIARAVSAGGRAIVLGYHQFTGPGIPSKNIYSMSQDVFDSEMKYLHDNGFNVVPLSDVVAFLKHQKDLPPNAVAITIDDGYKSALNYAEPVLKKYGYPWTYFVYPAFITRTEGKGAASWPDLVELGREGIDVECHSMTHPQLTKKIHAFHGSKPRLLTPEEYDQFLTDETLGAKQILERELNKKILYFAYPYGDYNKIVEAKAIAAGFEAIFTVAGNPVHVTTDIHSIGRYIITKPDEPRFVGYLHQGALSLAQVDPEPGAITSNPNPIISAVLGFNGDPASIETEITGFGSVRHDFDPQTSTVRLYLPHPLIQPQVQVGIRAKDAQTGQTMVANWHFNYEASGVAPAIHQPIGLPAVSAATNASPSSAAVPVSTPTFVTKTDPVVRPPSTAVSAPVSSATNTLSTPAPKDSTAP